VVGDRRSAGCVAADWCHDLGTRRLLNDSAAADASRCSWALQQHWQIERDGSETVTVADANDQFCRNDDELSGTRGDDAICAFAGNPTMGGLDDGGRRPANFEDLGQVRGDGLRRPQRSGLDVDGPRLLGEDSCDAAWN
jgi:hypothetical protein